MYKKPPKKAKCNENVSFKPILKSTFSIQSKLDTERYWVYDVILVQKVFRLFSTQRMFNRGVSHRLPKHSRFFREKKYFQCFKRFSLE